MQISVVRPGELGQNEIAAWRCMQRKTASLASPFLCPEFALAVDGVRQGARVAVLSDGPELVGFFPFERRRLGIGVPIGAGLNDCQALIHAPDAEWDPRELLRACQVSVWQFDNLIAGQLPFERYMATVFPSPIIDLVDGFEVYEKKLRIKSPKFCREIGRKARRLEREAGELRFTVDSRDPADLRTFMDWKADQYHRHGTINIFDRRWVVDLIEQLFSTHSDHFGALFSILYAGESPVAADFCLRSGHFLAAWYSAYDRRFSKQSPGLLQHLRMAEETAALGVQLIDMGAGPSDYKQTLKTGDLFVGTGTVVRGPARGGVHRARVAAEQWAEGRVKRHPALFRVANSLFRHYGWIR
jgi:CelD/BcsL family acetyltransferase involved in cellulose biosynthesis